MPILIEPKSYLSAFENGENVQIQYKRFQLEDLIRVYDIVGELLLKAKLDSFIPFVKTSLKELVQNAVKATQKRIYFQKSGLDISKNYEEGMVNFSEFLQSNKNMPIPDGILFSAEIRFEQMKDSLRIVVKNYGEVTSEERKSLELMFSRGKTMHSVQELLENEVKQKEGGGLGISMIIVLGRSLKINDPLKFESKNGFTEFVLTIPVNS
ncbi:MAG: hypothetical protein KDK36_19800 [Leptospiraceae bacterium]|nr:hypothetical protein [Leptospiraceae bacterium]